jgi:thiamine biosynthesis protein ThiS
MPPAVVSARSAGYRAAIVQVVVNDEPQTLGDGATVADLVTALGLGPRRIAVEVNRSVVPRAEYATTSLVEGDTIEIIHFVGGG